MKVFRVKIALTVPVGAFYTGAMNKQLKWVAMGIAAVVIAMPGDIPGSGPAPEVAVGGRDVIRILDGNDREIRRIVLPARLESGFVIRDGVVAFFGDDYHMHWFKIEENREVLLPLGPFLFGRSGFGPEVCRNPDIDVERGLLVFQVQPLWFFPRGGLERREYDELDEYAEICLIEKGKSGASRVSGGIGYAWRPWILEDRLVFSTPAGVGIRPLTEARPLALNRLFASKLKRRSEAFLEVLARDGGNLIMAEYAGSDLKNPRVMGIWSYNPMSENFRNLHRLQGGNLEFTDLIDISPEKDELLVHMEGGRVQRLRLDSMERRPLRIQGPFPVAVRYLR